MPSYSTFGLHICRRPSAATAAVCLAALASLVQSGPVHADDHATFEGLKAQAMKAWEGRRWADVDKWFAEARKLEPLGSFQEVELRFWSFVLQNFLDRADEALPIAEYNYEHNPCFLSAMELCGCYINTYDFARARRFLADYLEIPTGLSPEEGLEAIRQKVASLPELGQRACLRTFLTQVGIKQVEVTFALAEDLTHQLGRDELARLGGHPFTIYSDCQAQHIRYEVVNGSVAETRDGAGNRRLVITHDAGVVPTLRLDVTLVPQVFDTRKTEAQAKAIPSAYAGYFQDRRVNDAPNGLIEPQGETARSVSAVCAAASRFQYLQNVDRWWCGVEYSEPTPGMNFSSESMLRNRNGHCGDWSAGLAALLSARPQHDMPARQVYALCLQYDRDPGLFEYVTLGGHWTAEFYDAGNSCWVEFGARGTADPVAPRTPLLLPNPELIRLVAEDPSDEANIARAFAAMFYFFDEGGLRNTDCVFTGLSLDEPSPPE